MPRTYVYNSRLPEIPPRVPFNDVLQPISSCTAVCLHREVVSFREGLVLLNKVEPW